MIVRNEEEFLADCLASLDGVADEIVVVDTGSQDRTIEIARAAGARVLSHAWNDSFSEARNFSIDAASGDWILIIDADERLDSSAHEAIRNAISTGQFDAYIQTQLNYYSDDAADTLANQTCRLWRNRPGYRYRNRVHESIVEAIRESGGVIGTLDASIHHLGVKQDIVEARDKCRRYERMLERELAERPTDVFQLYNLAVSYSIAGRGAEAVQLLVRASELADERQNVSGWVYSALADAYCEQAEYREVIETAKRAQSRSIEHPGISYACGQAHFSLGEFSKATTMFEKAISLGAKQEWTGDSATWGWKAHDGAMRSLLSMGDNDGAIEHGRMVLADKPSDQNTHALMAAAYSKIGSAELAMEHMQRYVDLHPNRAQGWVNMGEFLCQQQRAEESLECYINAIKADGSCAAAYFGAGDILYYAGEYESAADLYTNGLAAAPDHAPGFFMLGNCYARSEAYEAAALAYVQSLAIDPSNADVRNNLECVEHAIQERMAA